MQERFTQESLADYIDTYRETLAQPGYAIGTWYDATDGRVWLDVVKLIHGRDEAERFGIDQNQIAIYHLKTGELKHLGGTGE